MAVTRLTQCGIGGSAYGTFLPKIEAVEEPAVTQPTLAGGDQEFVSWKDQLWAIHLRRTAQYELKKEVKTLKRVEQQIKAAEKQVAKKRTEGILANLFQLEMRHDEIVHRVRIAEQKLEGLDNAIAAFAKAEIEDDDEDVFLLT
jgi:DNA-binding protein YbaB